MICNERQYKLTKAQAKKFHEALSTLKKEEKQKIHPKIRKAEIAGLEGQLKDLKKQLREYESLRSGKRKYLQTKIHNLAQLLIQARIARGFNQKELADLLGLKEQQIQRYEATNYSSANLERITEVVRVLDIDVPIRIPLYK